MTRAVRIVALLAALVWAPAQSFAVSAVFDGDPIDPTTGLPYELLPDFPLIQPGPDAILGTIDDIIDMSVSGDIDLVVRSGFYDAITTIPRPAAAGGLQTLPVGIAGSRAAGGTQIPFTVFLSDGATNSQAPWGSVLAAADMDGIPVIVAAFADLDGDGWIGPTNRDAAGASDNAIEVRELEPVGRAVALFSGGIARGELMVHAGLAESEGGLTVALTAFALTGPFDANFLGGSIPSGPAITTAQPFLPQRDLGKLLRAAAVPIGPSTTLQPVIQFAALPDADGVLPFALPLDGSAPTTDAAVAYSQPATRTAFRENLPGFAFPRPVTSIALGTTPSANSRQLLLLPVDRWDNPSDPPPGFTVTLAASPPLQVVGPTAAGAHTTIDFGAQEPEVKDVKGDDGIPITVAVPPGTPDGTTGTLTVEYQGVVVGGIPYRVDVRANQPPVDLTVPSPQALTIQAAINSVFDRNGDGFLVIGVKPGLYRENVVVNRPLELRGDDAGTTVIQGDGSASVLSASAGNITIRNLTTVGGSSGFTFSSSSARLVECRAWHNLGAGISISGSGAQIWRVQALENAGDGLLSSAKATTCVDDLVLDNGGAGTNSSNAENWLINATRVAGNGTVGVSLVKAKGSILSDSQSVANDGVGIQVSQSQSSRLTNNVSALNDGDGFDMDQTATNLVSGNSVDSNTRYGFFVRRSKGDDFSAAPGVQAPFGDNTASGNRIANLLVRTN